MNKKDERVGTISQSAGMDDIYFWSKNSRPSPEKDHNRNSIAELCLAHLKTEATILKSIHLPEGETIRPANDLSPYLLYSLNKKRRWEAEEDIGLDVLDRAAKLNEGWKVLLLERVNLKSYIWAWPDFINGNASTRFMEDFKIRAVHKFEDGGYEREELGSTFGQRYSHFLKQNRQPQKDGAVEEDSKEPVIAYNFVRAPKNVFTLLQKKYISSNYGWEWPHVGYWRRVDLLKDHNLELRYGELEDLDAVVDDEVESADDLQNIPSKFYNLEDHIVDNDFVMVKNKKKTKKALSKKALS